MGCEAVVTAVDGNVCRQLPTLTYKIGLQQPRSRSAREKNSAKERFHKVVGPGLEPGTP